MNYNKKTIMDVDVAGKKILLRCDFNVPQDKETGAITSDKRIVAALPTIKYLLDNGAAVIACSHLGKPKGEWKEKLSLAPVAKRLSELLGHADIRTTLQTYVHSSLAHKKQAVQSICFLPIESTWGSLTPSKIPSEMPQSDALQRRADAGVVNCI